MLEVRNPQLEFIRQQNTFRQAETRAARRDIANFDFLFLELAKLDQASSIHPYALTAPIELRNVETRALKEVAGHGVSVAGTGGDKHGYATKV